MTLKKTLSDIEDAGGCQGKGKNVCPRTGQACGGGSTSSSSGKLSSKVIRFSQRCFINDVRRMQSSKVDRRVHLHTLGHCDLNDQNLFHSIIETSAGVSRVSKNPDDQTKVYSGDLER